ncbi:MMPL family transporter [Staphylococcus chromogenes]|nr:MMPL family transporter [Staphylococcus chromogenes]
MGPALYRIGYFAYVRKWVVLSAWALILGIAAFVGFQWAAPLSKDFSIPTMPSQQARADLDRFFPPTPAPPVEDAAGAAPPTHTETVVIAVPDGKKLSNPPHAARLQSLREDLTATGALRDATLVDGPYESQAARRAELESELKKFGIPASAVGNASEAIASVSPGENVATFDIHVLGGENARSNAQKVIEVLNQADQSNFQVAHYGEVSDTAEPTPMLTGPEILGLAVAAILLFIALGAAPAALVPVASALVSAGLSVVFLFAHNRMNEDLNFLTPMLMLMIGLAVGIDYALFIIARFRNEAYLALDPNLPLAQFRHHFARLTLEQRAQMMGNASAKAGSAVVFAGLTVVIALLSLQVVGIPFLSAMALSSATAVALAVLVSLTFLPALAGAFGSKLFHVPPRFIRVPDPENDAPTMGLRWIRLIRHRPAVFLLGAVALLSLTAIPAAQMQLAMPTNSTAPLGSGERRAADLVAHGFGPGKNAPMSVVIDATALQDYQRKAALTRVAREINEVEGVRYVVPTRANKDLSGVQLWVFTDFAANDPGAKATMERLRAHSASIDESFHVKYGVTGVTPVFVDLSTLLRNSLVPYALLVLALGAVVLVAVFRSLWVPVIAALGFALSVAATFGVTVAVFQQGSLDIIDDPQPIISFLPVILIGLIFGLAMDYQVFLVSRMREGWLNGKAAGDAVSNGFKHGARVVTAAALIMISVFFSFVAHDQIFIKTMGFALATAVLIDAFLVRMTIIPAAMFLLGERAWTLPGHRAQLARRVERRQALARD